MGATIALNVAERSLPDAMAELHMKEGFDVGLEMSGSGPAFAEMIDRMCNGGKIALLGIHKPGTLVDWNKIVFKGLRIKGIYGREMFETWYKMTTMLQSGLSIDPVITHRLPASAYEQAFAIMRSGQSGKVILDWQNGF